MEENQTNFNDIIGKFQEILKEKKINLNEIMEEEKESDPFNFDFDLDTIIKLKNAYQKINESNNPRNRLLFSLKPFLRESRKQKLDEYMKIANLLGILSLLNDTQFKDKGSANQ